MNRGLGEGVWGSVLVVNTPMRGVALLFLGSMFAQTTYLLCSLPCCSFNLSFSA